MCHFEDTESTQNEEEVFEVLQETRPIPLVEEFPEIPGFTKPPLDSATFKSIAIQSGSLNGGGYADVYRATWIPPESTWQKTVAVKIFRPTGDNISQEAEIEQRERIKKRLAREVTIWQKLNDSRNRIVPLYGYFFTAPIQGEAVRPCVVSPWRGKGSLVQHIRDHPQADRLALLTQAAEAVNVLHMERPPIIHLDVKPNNFLVNDSNEVELCDFGISRVLSGAPSGFSTKTGGGTVGFQAPEYLRNPKQYSTDLDVHSFGCCILMILSGQPPFAGLTSAMLTIELYNGKSPRQAMHTIPFSPNIANEIWALMDKCWGQNGNGRPTMDHVVKELKRISKLIEE